MDQTSTLHPSKFNHTDAKNQGVRGAKLSTLAIIKQFARTYMAVDKMPGLVLN